MLYIHKRSYGLEVHRFTNDNDCSELTFHKLKDNARLQPKSYKIGEHEFIGSFNLHEGDGAVKNDPFRRDSKDQPRPFRDIYDIYWSLAGTKMSFEEWLAIIPRTRYNREPGYHGLYWDAESKLHYLTLGSDKGPQLTLIEESSVIVGHKVIPLTTLVERRRAKLTAELERLDSYTDLLSGRHIYDLGRAPDENNRLPFSDWIADLASRQS